MGWGGVGWGGVVWCGVGWGGVVVVGGVNRLKITIECFRKTFLTTPVAIFLGPRKEVVLHAK